MSTVRRLSCFAVCLCLLLSALSVSSLAADDYSDAPNLIDPSQWTYDNFDLENSATVNYTYFSNQDIVRFWSVGGSYGVLGIVITPTSFIAGHSYYASFTVEQLNYGFREGEELAVGIFDSTDLLNSDFQSYQIHGPDFTLGREFTFSFTGDFYSNPVFGISFATGHGFDFRLKNVRVVDVTAYEEDQQTNKIGGFIGELGDRIEGFFDDLFEKIKGLFLPDEDFINGWKDDLDELLADHLGLVYDAGDFVSELLGRISDLLAQTDGGISLSFPEITLDLDGDDVTLVDETPVNFDFLDTGIFAIFYVMYKVILYIIFIMLLVAYAMRCFDKIMEA